MSRQLEVLFVVAHRGRYWVGHRAGPLTEDLAKQMADDFNRRKKRRRFAALRPVTQMSPKRFKTIARRARRLAQSLGEYSERTPWQRRA